MKTLFYSIIILGIFFNGIALSESIYSWKDEKGVRHFGDAPKKNATTAKVVPVYKKKSVPSTDNKIDVLQEKQKNETEHSVKEISDKNNDEMATKEEVRQLKQALENKKRDDKIMRFFDQQAAMNNEMRRERNEWIQQESNRYPTWLEQNQQRQDDWIRQQTFK